MKPLKKKPKSRKHFHLLFWGTLNQVLAILSILHHFIIGPSNDVVLLLGIGLLFLGESTLNRYKINQIVDRLDEWEVASNTEDTK